MIVLPSERRRISASAGRLVAAAAAVGDRHGQRAAVGPDRLERARAGVGLDRDDLAERVARARRALALPQHEAGLLAVGVDGRGAQLRRGGPAALGRVLEHEVLGARGAADEVAGAEREAERAVGHRRARRRRAAARPSARRRARCPRTRRCRTAAAAWAPAPPVPSGRADDERAEPARARATDSHDLTVRIPRFLSLGGSLPAPRFGGARAS